jgi:hypothetical protein
MGHLEPAARRVYSTHTAARPALSVPIAPLALALAPDQRLDAIPIMWQVAVGMCRDIREFEALRLEQDANRIDGRRR